MELGCGIGWIKSKHTGKCYKLFTTGKSWPVARRKCQNLGVNGDLASAPDIETSQFLAAMTNDLVWIGGQKGSDGLWMWSDGTPWNFENWDSNSGQPSESADENHLVLHNADPGLWSDANGEPEKKKFICQYVPGKSLVCRIK